MSSEEFQSEVNSLSYDDEFTGDELKSEDVDNLIQGLSFRMSNDTKIDSMLLNRSFTPMIEIFPDVINFTPTFPNVPLSQKITISNSGKSSEKLRISISGDKDVFLSSEKEIELLQGTTMNFFISFIPKTVSLYKASLIIEGRKSIVAPITGHCINSPLVYPSPKSNVWFFEREAAEREITFMNESVSLSLDVNVKTNSSLFKLSSSEFTILPKKKFGLNIAFTPTPSMVDISPVLTVSCRASGDKIDIPLRIAPPASTKILNFGCALTGKPLFHEVQTDKPYKIPTIQWPFAFEKEYSDDYLAVFSFCSQKPGTFTYSFELGKNKIVLTASSIKSPYAVDFSCFMDKGYFSIKNVTRSTISLTTASITSSLILDNSKFDLKPLQTININIAKVKDKQESVYQCCDVEIRCVINEKSISEIVSIPLIKQEASELHKNSEYIENDELLVSRSTLYAKTRPIKSVTGTILCEKNEKSFSISQSAQLSPAKRKSINKTSESMHNKSLSISHETALRIEDDFLISNEGSLRTKTKLIPFPQVSKEKVQSFLLSIAHDSLDSSIEMELPSWIHTDEGEEDDEGTSFLLTNNYLMTSSIFSQITVKNNADTLKIPAFAYKGSSFFVLENEIITENGTAELKVRNEGTRPGFIAFSVEEDPGFDVLVSPIAAVIPAGCEKSFKFFVSESAPQLYDVKIKAISGDEIMRQLRCAVQPGGYFEKSFANVKTKDEISAFRKSLPLFEPKSTVTIFKQLLTKNHIILTSGNYKKKSIAISSDEIKITNSSDDRVVITNLLSKDVSFTALPTSSSIIVSPTCGMIKKLGDVIIKVTMHEKGEGYVDIRCNNEEYSIHVIQTRDFYDEPPMSFVCGMKVADFGIMRRNESQQIEVPITNYTRNKIIITVKSLNESQNECFSFASNIAVPPLSEEKLFIDFTAPSSGFFEDELELSFNDEKSKLKLYGKGFTEKHSKVDFPSCAVGSQRKAKLKISNKTDEAVRVITTASKPFSFEETDFIIAPRCFVLCPIVFSPKVAGSFKGSGEIRSESGTLTLLSLFGESFQ